MEPRSPIRVTSSTLRRLAAPAAVGASAGAMLALSHDLYRAYAADIRAAYAAIDEAPTETVETAAGTVEFRTTGEGTPVLVSHGIVGGFDQAVQTGESLLDGKFRVIGVSRFGYLDSNLPADPTPPKQARAFADVLDHLGVDDAVVVGTSAGGAPALRFALEFPARTRALVLIGSTAPSDGDVTGPTGPPDAILRDWVLWALVTHAPWVFLRLFGVSPRAYRDASPAERERVDDLLDTLVPVAPRKPGIRTDTRVTNTEIVDRSDEYTLEALSAPTLVVHARDDPLASFDDAKRMADRIPNAEFRSFDTGGHLVFGHGDAVRDTVSAFVTAAASADAASHGR